jgi:hypothetical protein
MQYEITPSDLQPRPQLTEVGILGFPSAPPEFTIDTITDGADGYDPEAEYIFETNNIQLRDENGQISNISRIVTFNSIRDINTNFQKISWARSGNESDRRKLFRVRGSDIPDDLRNYFNYEILPDHYYIYIVREKPYDQPFIPGRKYLNQFDELLGIYHVPGFTDQEIEDAADYAQQLADAEAEAAADQELEAPVLPRVPEVLPETEDVFTNRFKCSVCLTNAVNTRLNSCGHLLCSACFVELSDPKKCPICRANINNGEPIFYGGYYNKYKKYLNKLPANIEVNNGVLNFW